MRRHSPGVKTKDELVAYLIQRISQEDPERVIGLLEQFVGEPRKARMQKVLSARLSSVTVFMDAPHDPHNGAAVLRSCEAFGVQALHIIESREKFLAAGSVTRGAQKWVDLLTHASEEEAIEVARREDIALVATHPEGDLLPHDLAKLPRVGLVLGNERDGISEQVRAACTASVRVPMRGFVESLNMSVTAAILLHAATADRPGDLPQSDFRRLYARGLYFSYPGADKVLGFEP